MMKRPFRFSSSLALFVFFLSGYLPAEGSSPTESIKDLITQLKDTHNPPWERVEAADKLGRIKKRSNDAIKALLYFLGDRDRDVARSCAVSLDRCESREIIASLLRIVNFNKNPRQRWYAVFTLSLMSISMHRDYAASARSILDVLLRVLPDDNIVQYHAIGAITNIILYCRRDNPTFGSEAIQVLCNMVSSSDFRVSCHAASELEMIADPAALQKLQEALNRKYTSRRNWSKDMVNSWKCLVTIAIVACSS